MSAPRKFDEETRARAVRLYTDRLRDHGECEVVPGLVELEVAVPRLSPAVR